MSPFISRLLFPAGLLFASVCLNTAVSADHQPPILSLVIDDLGYSLENGTAVIELPGDHTYAILPDASYSTRLAQHAQRLNKEVILHLPMQSIGSASAREPHALDESMDEDQLTSKVHSLLSEIPFIRGVNNHMGSHLTEFDFFMRPVMDSIRSYNPELYFLDSKTTPRSVAHMEALDAGLNAATRDIFLDDAVNLESIRLQYQLWLEKAREQGSAIAIGHPYKETIQVLQENLADTSKAFRFMRVSRLIAERQKKSPEAPRLQSLTTLDPSE